MITPANTLVSGSALEREVRELMTPGVVTIVEDASLAQVRRAIVRHGVHALLVVGRDHGRPLGWVTARGLLGLLDCDPTLVVARDAITERAVSISPSATAREAADALARERVSHLLVAHTLDRTPEGVVADVDLARLDRHIGD